MHSLPDSAFALILVNVEEKRAEKGELPGPFSCTLDCGTATAGCQLEPLEDATYTVVDAGAGDEPISTLRTADSGH